MSAIVLGIGELLWDKFPDQARLGGAPANFAFHATQLGANGVIVSRVGTDRDGDKLLAELAARGLATGHVQHDPEHPTGTVIVSLHDGQPLYEITENSSWDFLEETDDLDQLAARADAVCFGTLAQRYEKSRSTIQWFLKRTRASALRLFDVNLRQPFYDESTLRFGMEHATAVKLNGGELETLAAIFDWPVEPRAAMRKMMKDFRVKILALTLGADGCILSSREETVSAPSPKIELVDAVGAGDAFAAALVVGLLKNKSLTEIAAHANRIGAFVASQSGAMPGFNANVI